MKIGKVLASLLLSTVIGTASAALVKAVADDGAEYTLGEVNYRSSYVTGETLDVLQSEFVSGDKSEKAQAIVHFPSGKAYRKESVVLSEAGVYTVEYKATIDGKLMSEEKNFSVYQSKYSVSSSRSSVTYGCSDYAPQNAEGTVKEGLAISLAQNDVFRYNKTIDLNDYDKTENALQLYLTPKTEKTAEAFVLNVRFIDAYDPDNYVWVRSYAQASSAWDSWNALYMFQTACVPSIGQSLMGWFYDHDPAYGGDWYYEKLKAGATSEGYAVLASVYGLSRYAEYDNASKTSYSWIPCDAGTRSFMDFRFDYAEKQLYGTPFLDLKNLITDFDDASIYGDLQWEGFKTGECYVEISTDQCVAETFNFVVTQIGNEDLTEELLTDERAPDITVDYAGYDENSLPDALIGCEYPVFTASATDSGKEVGVSSRVFYRYGEADCFEVDSYGGKFLPNEAGLYTIVYTASDWFGNMAVKKVEITAGTEASAPYLSVDVASAEKTGVAGSTVVVPIAEYGGGVGSLAFTAVASDGKSDYDVSGGSFIPMAEGKYTVSYTVTDFVGQTKTESYEVDVADEMRPVFIDTVVLPKYFIENGDYTAPDLSAYDLHSSAVYETDITLIDGNGETKLKGKAFSPTADENGYATLRYSASNSAGENYVDYKIPVVGVLSKTGKNDFKRYFLGEGIATASATKYISATTTVSGTSAFDFIKEIAADGFSFRFGLDNENGNNALESVSVYLTDYADRSLRIMITISRTENGRVYLNGVRTNAVAGGFCEAGAYVSFGYSASTRTIEGFSVDLLAESYLNGSEFVGFPSGRVYMTVSLDDAAVGTVLYMQKLNNANLTSAVNDLFAPQLVFAESYPSSVAYGTILTTPDFIAVDVFDTSVSVLMTATDGNGKVLSDKNGVLLENRLAGVYEIVADFYGTMRVSYTVSDAGKSATSEFIVEIPDTGAPEITVGGVVATSAKVGETILIPTATAKDAVSGECFVYVAVFGPDMSISVVSDSFTAAEKGIYTLKYFSYDDVGNMVILSFDIVVS